MNESTTGRGALIRDSLIFQLKLMADGFRDLVLVPISLVATLAGVLRGGSEPDREFRQVLDFGRQTERWINLFGNHEPFPEGGQAGSLDALLDNAERVVREQARSGGLTDNASRTIERAIRAAQRHTRAGAGRGEDRSGGAGDEPGNSGPAQ